MATHIIILPHDRPAPNCCSRCGVQLAGRVVVAVWNGVEFAYCAGCQPLEERDAE